MITQLYGDCRTQMRAIADKSVHLIVTSPPYYALRSYTGGDEHEIGTEETPEAYIQALVEAAREMKRVLRDDGSLILNLGDTFSANRGYQVPQTKHIEVGNSAKMSAASLGLPPKNKLLIPHRVAIALQNDGWILRQDIPWIKFNGIPESVADRFTTAHEYFFHFTQQEQYWWDAEAAKLPSAKGSCGSTFTNGKTASRTVRPPGQGERNDDSITRNYRTSDTWRASLDLAITAAQTQLEQLEALRESGGAMGDEDTFLALQVNLRGSPLAHYAMFSSHLVAPFLKAGCPRQCCPHCGAGWIRIVEKDGGRWEERKAAGEPLRRGYSQNAPKEAQNFGQSVVTTIDFEPSCTCPEHEPIPGIVLDPFAGSGTTGRVATHYQRDAILIDLNEANATIQAQQLDNVQLTLFD
jgi:DNA modification methylase